MKPPQITNETPEPQNDDSNMAIALSKEADQAIDGSDKAINLVKTVDDKVKTTCVAGYSMLIYPFAVFILTTLYYTSLFYQGVSINKYSQNGVFIVTGVALIISIGYYIYNNQIKAK